MRARPEGSTTRLRFSLLGRPVRHSVSPAMCTAAFAALGLPHVYTAIDVPTAAGLARMVDDLRTGTLAGCNVTVPYKRAVLDFADVTRRHRRGGRRRQRAHARPSGRVVAHNTDAEALGPRSRRRSWAAARARRARDHRGRRRGPGGARRLPASSGFELVCMTSRSWTNTETMFDAPGAERARALGALTAPWPTLDEERPTGKLSQALRIQWSELVAHADCVIQATSAGMLGADPGEDVVRVVPWDSLPAHAVAYDVVYNPRVTPFLQEATKLAGSPPSTGWGCWCVRPGCQSRCGPGRARPSTGCARPPRPRSTLPPPGTPRDERDVP